MVDNLKSWIFFPVVNRRDVDKDIEIEFIVLFKEPGQFNNSGLFNYNSILSEPGVGFNDKIW